MFAAQVIHLKEMETMEMATEMEMDAAYAMQGNTAPRQIIHYVSLV
jgi:hypothetical protein